MDINAPSTAVTVLPPARSRRWLSPRRGPATPTPEPAVEPSDREQAADSDSPVTATSDPMAVLSTPATPPAPTELAPLAAFGRWMADFAGEPAPEDDHAGEVDSSADAGSGLVSYSSSVLPSQPPTQPAYEPSVVRPDDSELVAQLRADLKAATEELEAYRQRSAAERMHLLEELASTRDARRAAETELAAVQAILDTAERKLPAPRRENLHAVS